MQRRALDNARQKAMREHLEKMRALGSDQADHFSPEGKKVLPEMATVRLAQAKKIFAQTRLGFA
jgi:hypothetical protein